MKKLKIAATAVLVSLFTTTAHAQGSWDNGISIWLDVTDFLYEEPGVMKQEGTLVGAGGSYTWQVTDLSRLRIQGDWRVGTTDYTGGTQSGIPGTSEADDRVARIEINWGLVAPLDAGTFTADIGFGVRDWDQDLKDGQTIHGDPMLGYERGHRYQYIPIGLGWQSHAQGRSWRWHIGGGYQYVTSGEARADIGGGTTRFSMNDGYGARFNAGITWYEVLVPRLGFDLYAQRWDFDRSSIEAIGNSLFVEPENETTELGLKLIVGW